MHDNTSRQRPESAQNSTSDTRGTTVPIAEAAARFGISVDAVRKRIQRGKLQGQKTDAGWTVVWTEPDIRPESVWTAGQDASALVAHLEGQIAYLRDQVAAEREARSEAERRHAAEIERRDVLLRDAIERIPLGLPSGASTQTLPQDANERPLRGDVAETAQEPLRPAGEPQEPVLRRLWRRIRGNG